MCVCIWWHISTRSIERISTSFDYTYSIWDAEWWWVSRLDFAEKSRLEFLWDMRGSRLGFSIRSRLDFYVWIWEFFCPITWQTALLMLRSLSPQHPDTFYKDWVQITYRLSNQIKHSFIFKKPFFNWFQWFSVSFYTICPLRYLLDYLNRL